MSFTDEVKHELTRLQSKELPELAALIRMNGSVQIINKELAVKIRLFHGDLARKIYTLIKDRFELKMEIRVKKDRHFSGGHNVYELFLLPRPEVRDFLKRLGFLDRENRLVFRIKDEFTRNRESRKAYLRGAFLGGGSVNKPDSEYHLEYRCEHRQLALDLIELLASFDLKGRLNEHNHKYIIYMKSFGEITTLLNLMGAQQAQLKMENRYVFKDIKNSINRKVNCETANLDKTVEASLNQLEDIETIRTARGLESLPASLQEIARCRVNNPYASLKELGEMLNPRLSKSGVNHRMRRLRKIAAEIRGGL